MRKISKEFQYGQHQVKLETGQIARQADGAVLCTMGETVVLATTVAKRQTEEGRDFFPLTVNYQEKSYAAGKVPGGYFKREGRPTEKETLVSRLIDRPIRPLFPEGFTNEIQVIVTVLSMDPDVPTDIPAIIGASAALAISGVPFLGPIAAARVGYQSGQYLLNPSLEAVKTSELDLVVAGTKHAVIMVESSANQLPEEVMLGAVMYGHEQMQVVIRAIEELVAEGGRDRWDWTAPAIDSALLQAVRQEAEASLVEAYKIKEKLVRQDKIKSLRDVLIEKLCVEADGAPSNALVGAIFHDLEKEIVRRQILNGEARIDGRDTKTVRPITCEVGVLPRVHGSALFTRGETQALVITTLGTERDSQMIDDLDGDRKEEFIFHYNFPPYCVNETGFMSGPKRREIGHGKLAKRGVQAVVPTMEEFPYVVRVVSEITESNGSSSMASVCGSSLSMMDAGIPLKAPVAGIAMGLIKEADQFAVLTDILGDEDHLGDMDFKVAGTEKGVNALQMDIKIDGITKEIMEQALKQARDGRLHILGIMNETMNSPRQAVSKHAPRYLTIKINPDKIREVIGKGGAVIREITESTNTTIDISDEGVIKIAAIKSEDAEAAKKRIEQITEEVEIGRVYEGPVVKLVDFGAFVEVLPGKQGLVHISQIAQERVENVHDYLEEGQIVKVKVTDIDRQGRVRLSMKEAV